MNFKCWFCDKEYDGDYIEMYELGGRDCCEDCYSDQKKEVDNYK